MSMERIEKNQGRAYEDYIAEMPINKKHMNGKNARGRGLERI